MCLSGAGGAPIFMHIHDLTVDLRITVPLYCVNSLAALTTSLSFTVMYTFNLHMFSYVADHVPHNINHI